MFSFGIKTEFAQSFKNLEKLEIHFVLERASENLGKSGNFVVNLSESVKNEGNVLATCLFSLQNCSKVHLK